MKREEWDSTKFPDIQFYGKDKDRWCPLCDGRTVERDGSYCCLLFFSHDYFWNRTEDLLEARTRVEMKVKAEAEDVSIKAKKVYDILRPYYKKNLQSGFESSVPDFDSFEYQNGKICYHCLQQAKSELKAQIEGR